MFSHFIAAALRGNSGYRLIFNLPGCPLFHTKSLSLSDNANIKLCALPSYKLESGILRLVI